MARRYPDPALETWYERELEIVVDRERAGFSAWYELFPRSWSTTPGKHGTLRDVAKRMDYVAEMGFDVLYFPPSLPSEKVFARARTTPLKRPREMKAARGRSAPRKEAIRQSIRAGNPEGFRRRGEASQQLKMEVALDIAFQCAPDHPWVTEHPEFFKKRPDGSIQYAENPPKEISGHLSAGL